MTKRSKPYTKARKDAVAALLRADLGISALTTLLKEDRISPIKAMQMTLSVNLNMAKVGVLLQRMAEENT